MLQTTETSPDLNSYIERVIGTCSQHLRQSVDGELGGGARRRRVGRGFVPERRWVVPVSGSQYGSGLVQAGGAAPATAGMGNGQMASGTHVVSPYNHLTAEGVVLTT